jgi:hypothetical protein
MILTDLQTLFSYLTPISLTIGVIYHIMTLNNTRKNQQLSLETRQAQLFMQIYNRLNEADFIAHFTKVMTVEWADFNDFLEKFGPEKPDNYNSLWAIIGYYEGIGVLIKEKYVDIRLVAELMAGITRQFWEKMEPIYEDGKKYWNYPRLWSETEYLYNELMRYMEEHPELRT